MGFVTKSGLTITYTELGRKYLSNVIPAKKTVEVTTYNTLNVNDKLNLKENLIIPPILPDGITLPSNDSNTTGNITDLLSSISINYGSSDDNLVNIPDNLLNEDDTLLPDEDLTGGGNAIIDGNLSSNAFINGNTKRYILNDNDNKNQQYNNGVNNFTVGSIFNFSYKITNINPSYPNLKYQIIDNKGNVYIDKDFNPTLNKQYVDTIKLVQDANFIIFKYNDNLIDLSDSVNINDIQSGYKFTFDFDLVLVSYEQGSQYSKEVNGLVVDYFTLGDSDINYFDGHQDNMVTKTVANSGEQEHCINGTKSNLIKFEIKR